MKYYGGEALGLVETVGMLPALEAADKMLKAADVDLISYENVGSTLVTIIVKGDIAAVEAAVEAGAADAMCKASNVDLIGYENVASGYISVLVSGDIDACKVAVESGIKAVEDMGSKVYSSVVIPSPHNDIGKIISRYSLEI